jgi:peptidyl-dipeptidase A
MATTSAGASAADEARAFTDQAEARLLELSIRQSRAQWVQQTFITEDTELLAAEANKELIAASMELAAQARRFDGQALPDDVARKLLLLKLAITLPAPSDPRLQTELTQIAATLEGMYGKGKYAPPGGEPVDLTALSRLMATSRDYDELLDAWRGWRTVSPPMRPKYARFVELANAGARDLGFADMGALWRAGYDMPPAAFAAELERLWNQVRPFYASLHAYVRAALVRHYGPERVPSEGPIPAHLLGNMWSQSWENVYPLVAPPGEDRGYDLTEALKAKQLDAQGMVRFGEGFFTSLGFEPLPTTFWERSLFVKPRDREVVCHASAWDIDSDQDLRIKMCIEVTEEDFVVVHHELGHNFYQRAYRRQPFLFRNSANDGFHEAIGDAIALSVTPRYLVEVGLLPKEPSGGDLGVLMKQALAKVAFLPFGLLIDQWRWKVFSGEIPPTGYNASWWELVGRYQGVAPPVPRSEADFDPGAKYHVAANVPYTRYFLAHVLQFQFHRALCRAAGQTGPLHTCSIYGSRAAGEKLAQMLELGQSRPWPEALHALMGERQLDASAMLEYFAPLRAWLDEQNRGRKTGW